MNETKSMSELSQVYAVLARGRSSCDQFEMVQLFLSKESSETYAQELRRQSGEDWSEVVVEAMESGWWPGR